MAFRSLAFLLLGAWMPGLVAEPPTPAAYLGFEVGADRKLADFTQITGYFKALAAASDRVVLQDLGPTSQDRKMFMAVISSAENLRNLPHHQATAKRLADPRGLAPAEIEALAKAGKAIVLVTCSQHASEIGASQLSLEWAHSLATTQDPVVLKRLEDVILLLVPTINPDGLDIEVDWYRKHLGTPVEGNDPPWPYHVYAGHDNNRDWFMLNLAESRAVNRMVYHQWFPQVWLDMHQMGDNSARMFVPPYTNPTSPNIPPLIHRMTDVMGTLMSLRLEEAGKPGVGYGYAFDVYWPGSSCETGHWKNTLGLLTELASCRLATPVRVDGPELSGMGKGLAENKVQVNFPNPWKGGVWRLRDILDYERIAADALLEGCAAHREALLRNRARMAMDAVTQAEPGLWHRIPFVQRDPLAGLRLAGIMQENGVEVFADAEAFWIPAAQPLGRFVKEMLEVQRYPEVRPMPGTPILAPYDVTAWTLPLMLGATVERAHPAEATVKALHPMTVADGPQGGASGPGALLALDAPSHEVHTLVNRLLAKGKAVQVAREAFSHAYRRFPAGTLLLPPGEETVAAAKALRLPLQPVATVPASAVALKAPRVGLYRAWTDGSEEGWLRLMLERHALKPAVVEPKAVAKGALRKAYDVLILPPYDKGFLLEGKPKPEQQEMWFMEEYPEPYKGGIGKEGATALKAFVEEGGTLICMGEACNLPLEDWGMPVKNPLAKVKGEVSLPGPLLSMGVVNEHPVTWGLPARFAGYPAGNVALHGYGIAMAMPRTLLTAYPDDARDILASGWIKGADRLANLGTTMAVDLGKGHLVLFAFDPVFRNQSEATYRLLLNAIAWGGMEVRN